MSGVTKAAMNRPRHVSPEWLDALSADDPRAVRSRRDLRRVNRLMGAFSIVQRALDRCVAASPPRLVELGAGDGSLMVRLARSRCGRWPGADVTLLDMQPAVGASTLEAIRALGWSAEVIAADALEWLTRPAAGERPLVFANLFVHHFEGERLNRLLTGIAARAQAFVCCEPRRSTLALAGSRLLVFIGANDVTRHDAVASVHAGFRDGELGAAWAQASGERSSHWRVDERRAGLFSHLFVATRTL